MTSYRKMRKELGLTQVKLARIAGVAQPTISDRETGRCAASREAVGFLLWLKTLPRERLEALLADPSTLET